MTSYVYFNNNGNAAVGGSGIYVTEQSANSTSWSVPVPIKLNGSVDPNMADANIIFLSDGTELLAYSTLSATGGPPAGAPISTAISTDGINFTDAMPAFTLAGNLAVSDPSVVQLVNGSFLMSVGNYGHPGTNAGVTFYSSADGRNYSPTGVTLAGDISPCLVRLGNGDVRLFESVAGGIGSFISTDNGQSWTQEAGVRLALPSDAYAGLPSVVQTGPSQWSMVVQELTTIGADPANANNDQVVLATSKVGFTFTLLQTGIAIEAGSPDIIVNPPIAATGAAGSPISVAAAASEYQQGALAASVAIADSAANIQSNLTFLATLAAAGDLTSIALSGSGTPTISVSVTQASADAAVFQDIGSSYSLAVTGVSAANAYTEAKMAHVGTVSVSDSAGNVASHLDQLQSVAATGQLSAITLTDSGAANLTVAAAQWISDAGALAVLAGNYVADIEIGVFTTDSTINGLAGHGAVAVFSGPSQLYSVTAVGNGAGFTVTYTGTGPASVNQFSFVDALQFTDLTEIVASQTPPTPGAVSSTQVTELYSAVLARIPDVGGLAFYQAFAASHPTTPLQQFAEWFLASSEYAANPAHNYAQSAAGDEQFITDSYNNLLQRSPSASEVSFYETNVMVPALANLTAGSAAYKSADAAAHALMLVYFSQSPEFLADVTITAQNPASAQHWLVLI